MTEIQCKMQNLRVLHVFLCFFLISSILFFASKPAFEESARRDLRQSRRLQQLSNDSLFLCIPSGIFSFPPDFFTQEQRLEGGVILHLLITLYVCAMIAVVCDNYFIPSLEIISDKMRLPSDVAGATFMAIGTSAPELFSSIAGSFVTQGDIGVGTIIGSAVFNILFVTGLVGLVLWKKVLTIDWYPIARDCTSYGLTVGLLVWIISDNVVTWWESLVLLTVFLIYIFILFYNEAVEKCSKELVMWIKEKCSAPNEEKQPLFRENAFVPELLDSRRKETMPERDSFSVEFPTCEDDSNEKHIKNETPLGDDEFPGGSPDDVWHFVWRVLMYPATFVFYLTIPDSRRNACRHLFLPAFLISVAWIGVLSYLAVWMVTVIGYTFSIPDSVSGLTILAAGTSVPEIISSIIVARNGLGNMAISNLVGSNTFDISFCLGAPWLVKALLSPGGYLIVYSSALTYTTATLLLTLLVFVAVFQLCRWKLNRAVGFIFVFTYIVFVIFGCMYELNVFGEINVPVCDA